MQKAIMQTINQFSGSWQQLEIK